MRRAAAPDRVLALLGLAARAGAAVPGTAAVRAAVRTGGARFVLVAADASENTREKLLPLLAARCIAHRVAYDRASLGEAVGRAPLGAVGITDPSMARRIAELLAAGS